MFTREARPGDLAFRETKGEVKLDGRRLGFIYRNLLANRAVEIAKAEAAGDSPPEFRESARYVVLSCPPSSSFSQQFRFFFDLA